MRAPQPCADACTPAVRAALGKSQAPRADACTPAQRAALHKVAQWRQATAHLVLLLTHPEGRAALAPEAGRIRRQCAHLAAALAPKPAGEAQGP